MYLALSAVLVSAVVQAKNLAEFSSAVERSVAQQAFPFANAHLKQLCHEWPVCEDWVNNKALEDPSFQVVDAEATYWVKQWDGERAIWNYHFYVQVQENGQINAYQFIRRAQGPSYEAARLIQHFPGHPDKPAQHIVSPTIESNEDRLLSLCDSWAGCRQWYDNQSGVINAAVTSQYIYQWDSQDNALWKKRLYIKVVFAPGQEKALYFQAYQTTAGGDFIYQVPVEIRRFPYRLAL